MLLGSNTIFSGWLITVKCLIFHKKKFLTDDIKLCSGHLFFHVIWKIRWTDSKVVQSKLFETFPIFKIFYLLTKNLVWVWRNRPFLAFSYFQTDLEIRLPYMNEREWLKFFSYQPKQKSSSNIFLMKNLFSWWLDSF